MPASYSDPKLLCRNCSRDKLSGKTVCGRKGGAPAWRKETTGAADEEQTLGRTPRTLASRGNAGNGMLHAVSEGREPGAQRALESRRPRLIIPAVFRLATSFLVWMAMLQLCHAQQTDPGAIVVTGVPSVPARSVVYRVQDSRAISDYDVDPGPVRRMVDDLVMAATGEFSVVSAWASLVKPTDIVGIKVCANGAPLFSTHPEVIRAIILGLNAAGVPSQNIVVWDRDEDLLKRAGYHSTKGGYRLMWNTSNYDPRVVLSSSIAGKLIYGDLLFVGKQIINLKEDLYSDPKGLNTVISNPGARKGKETDQISGQSHVSRVLTQVVSKVINVPVLSDNVACGLSGALFNMTIQNMDNWRRLVQDPVNGDPAIPESYADPRISDKVVLHLMDGLVALYAGAPMGNINYAIQHGALYASKDPVALDAVAAHKLDQWRVSAKMTPVSKIAKYLQTATTYGLGNSDLSRIDTREVR